MINKVISTAVKLWLRSQVNKAEDLQVTITGSNRQILKGYIPEVFLTCSKGVYQGLHLSQIELTGTNIAFNVTEVVKHRKPLKLLEPVLVDITVLLAAVDLQASLASSLLSDGLTDFLSSLLATQKNRALHHDRMIETDAENSVSSDRPIIPLIPQIYNSQNSTPELNINNCQITWSTIAIAEQKLNLKGILINSTGKTIELNIAAGLTLADSHTLLLSPLQIETIPELAIDFEDRLKIDLGTEVAIAELSIQSDRICCFGKITVLP